jgi:hypothetical protein
MGTDSCGYHAQSIFKQSLNILFLHQTQDLENLGFFHTSSGLSIAKDPGLRTVRKAIYLNFNYKQF